MGDSTLNSTTPIKASHINGLRTFINNQRTSCGGAGLGAYTWTNNPIVPGVTRIREIHFRELRTAYMEIFSNVASQSHAAYLGSSPINQTNGISGSEPINATNFTHNMNVFSSVTCCGDGVCNNLIENAGNCCDCAGPCPPLVLSPCSDSTYTTICGDVTLLSTASGGSRSVSCTGACIGGPLNATCTNGVWSVTGSCSLPNCGDAFCDSFDGEDDISCPSDCRCTNGALDGDEYAIDCGGADCPACPCSNNGIQDGDEIGIDCGGTTCGTGACCNHDFDCDAGETGLFCSTDCCDNSTSLGDLGRPGTDDYCANDLSSPQNGVLPGGTFVSEATLLAYCDDASEYCDTTWHTWGIQFVCGNIMGATWPDRYDSQSCPSTTTTCLNGICEPGESAFSCLTDCHCEDTVQNEDETAVDCGGALCAPCCNNNGTCGTGETGANCPHDCCDASVAAVNCVNQGRADGYNYCTGNLTSSYGTNSGYAFIPDGTMLSVCDSGNQCTARYDCGGEIYYCRTPMAGTVETKWSTSTSTCP